MKEEIRVLGIDDGFFVKKKTEKVLVVGAILRGNKELEGVLSCYIDQDGLDSTQKLIELVNKSKHKLQLRVIMINGTTLAGFNIIDIKKLSEETRLPVIAVLRKKPDYEKVLKALENFSDKEERKKLIEKAGEIYSYKKIFFQIAGLKQDKAQEIIDVTLRKSNLPEPIRIAHIIASGITTGESTKRA